MAKNRKDNIDSFSGMFQGTETPEQEQLKGQESIETLEGGKYMPTPAEKAQAKAQAKEKVQTQETPQEKPQAKKKGRPKVNRELKKRYSFTMIPSLYEQSSEIASNEGKSLSELITDFLTEYVGKNS